jgi:hypothetical protein
MTEHWQNHPRLFIPYLKMFDLISAAQQDRQAYLCLANFSFHNNIDLRLDYLGSVYYLKRI